MRWPWVSRFAFDLQTARADKAEAMAKELMGEVLRLKQAGFYKVGEVKPPTLDKVMVQDDRQIVKEAETAFLQRMTADLMHRGASPGEAAKEAQRIRTETMSIR